MSETQAGRTLPGTKVAALATVVDYATTNRKVFYRDGVRKQADYITLTAVNPATNEAPACDIKVLINAGSATHATIAAKMAATGTTTAPFQEWFLWNPKNQGSINVPYFDKKSARTLPQFIDTIDFLPVLNATGAAADTDIYTAAAER